MVKKKVSFGAIFTQTSHSIQMKTERRAYMARHQPNQNLWNKPTISASIKDMEQRFKIDIKKK